MPQYRAIAYDNLSLDSSNIGYPKGFFRNCPQGQIWQILGAEITLVQDNTTTGIRYASLKLQYLATNTTMAILASVGDDLSTAGTGTTTFFASGGFNSFFVPPGLSPTPAQMAVTGSMSVWVAYGGPILVAPGLSIQTSGQLLGADYVSGVQINYLEWSDEEFQKKMTPG